MIPIQVHLVAIPGSVWETQPVERPLAELAKDALGAERRIRKGQNLARETTRYRQLCLWFETVTLSLIAESPGKSDRPCSTLVLKANSAASGAADHYCELIGLLLRPQVWERVVRGYSDQLGVQHFIRSFCCPGRDVKNRELIYRRLSPSFFAEIVPGDEGCCLRYAAVAAEIACFLRAAKESAMAVVEVLSMQPGIPSNPSSSNPPQRDVQTPIPIARIRGRAKRA